MSRIGGRNFRMVVYNAAASGNLQRIKVFAAPNLKSKTWIDGCLNDNFSQQYPLVVAARKGHLDVVQYLVSIGADTSAKGVVEFDNDEIHGTPALWAAAAAGHLAVVQFLVEEAGADVNQTTQTQSTPLRGACYDGHLDIVNYLLDHGADINIPNRHGHTSLMIAAYRNKIDIVRTLLERSCDFDIQTSKGNSALHDAAESGNKEIVELLIAAGAVLKKDHQDVCPLLCAAQSGHPEVVEVLINETTSNILKRDAYKLLGCTYVDKKMDTQNAEIYWKKALSYELTSEEWQTIIEWETFTEPMEVYEHEVEVHRLCHLARLNGDMDLMRMQSLLVRERILGGAHPDVHYYLRFRGAVYCDLGDLKRCYKLWKHALELQQKHFAPLHVGTVTTIQSFQETFGLTLNDYVNERHGGRDLLVSSKWVAYVFDKTCHELERTYEWGNKPFAEKECCVDEPCPHFTIEAEKKKLVVTALQLVNMMDRLSLPTASSSNNDKPIKLDIGRLVVICFKLRLPILHYALEETDDDGADFMALPKASILCEILKYDVDMSMTDDQMNSPIHVLLSSSIVRRSLIRILLDHGAPVFACNSDNVVVYDALQDIIETEKCRDLPLGRYITLKGLAANAIKRKIPNFEVETGMIPLDLVDVLGKH